MTSASLRPRAVRLRLTPAIPAPTEFARQRVADLAGAILAMLLGAAVVLAAFGPGILDPRATGWMLAGPLGPDPVQYLLGWTWFARSPWALPPGLNPDNGLEIGSSIFYADAIPLLALPLKALRGIVEVPQYWGLWLLGCGMVQALLGWRLMRLATADPLARIAGAGLLVLQPMLLTRMGGHLALAGQWVLLAALLLALRDRRRHGPASTATAWALLQGATSLIHGYLLAMTMAIWVADLAARTLGGEPSTLRPPRPVAARLGFAGIEALAVIGTACLGLWAAGFFVLAGGHGAPGYGELGLDLLAPFDPTGWGAFLPELPGLHHGESGGSYLGLGGLLLLGLGAAAAWRQGPAVRAALHRHALLAAVLLGLCAFAVTHRVTLGGVEILTLPLPETLERLAATLRASERFFWPLGLALLLGAAALLARHWGGRRTGWVLATLLAIQAADLAPGLATLRGYVAAAPREAPPRLTDPFWAEAAHYYDRLRAVPAANAGPGWEPLARFAARHGLATDAVYLARVDPGAVAALRARVAADLAARRPEPATLYVLRDAEARRLGRAAADPARDLLAEIDGLTVFAPGWHLRLP